MKKLIPHLIALLIVVLFLFWFAYPKLWPFFIFLLLVVLFVAVFLLLKKISWEFIAFFSGLFFLIGGSFLFLFFLENRVFKYIIVILVSLFVFLILRAIYSFLYDLTHYIPYSLENIFAYSNLISLFFIYVAAFSYWILAILRLRYLLTLIFVASFVLFWQTLWINKIQKKSVLFSLVIALLMLEFYWSLHFWPTSFFVNGLLMTVVFYFFSNILLHHLRQTLQKKVLLRYLILSAVVIISTISTASWL